MAYMRLGDLLLSSGVISHEQLERALELQKESKERLGDVLVQSGIITEQQLIEALKIQLGVEFVDLTAVSIPVELAKYVPRTLAKKYCVVPVKLVRDTLYLAMSDPLDFIAQEEVKAASRKRVIPMIATHRATEQAISRLYGSEGTARVIEEMKREAGSAGPDIVPAQLAKDSDSSEGAPTIRFVNSLIERAFAERASDIHLEPQEGEMVVRMRIDGLLRRVLTVPAELQSTVISRLKIMAKLDIVEKRIPQDGRAVLPMKGTELDMRTSTLPTIHGEKVVIRILRRNEETLNRRGIGIPASEDAKIDKLLGLTSGVIMIVGPTGSGKSSTMYTLIRELLSDRTNLITLEDPVEYHIDGATQVQINEKVGLTFASGLRSILRQDPDIICVGEIRDGETAEIAMRAAMTGHLVITTVHTEDAISAIDRLRDMGVPPYLIAAGLRGVISQRLLRRICPSCKQETVPSEKSLELAGVPDVPGKIYWHGAGCDQCFRSGYRGRIGVFEVMMVQEELRRCILDGADRKRFMEAAREASGYVTMAEHARKLVDKGITTVDEVIRTLMTL